jgi:hypothetical protein
MADLKKFTARRLIEQLNIERREWLLKILRDFRLPHKTASTHQVWQEGFHPTRSITTRRLGKSWSTYKRTQCVRAWSLRQSTGVILRHMSGVMEQSR